MRNDSGISLKRVLLSIFFIAFVMPVLIFSAGYRYLNKANLEFEETSLLRRAEPAASVLEGSLNNGTFWCSQLNAAFSRSADVKEFQAGVESLSARHNQKLRYVIWKNDSTPLCSNFSVAARHSEWLAAGRIFRTFYKNPAVRIELRDEFLLKKLLGPHLQGKRLYETFRLIRPRILETDFAMKHPLVWVNSGEEFTALVLLPPAILNKSHGVTTFFRQFADMGKCRDEFALLTATQLYSNSSFAVAEINNLKDRLLKTGKKVLLTGQWLVFGEQLSDGSFFVVARAIKASHDAKAEGLFALCLLFFLLLIIRTFPVTRLSGGLSVNTAIYVFIGLSNILPLCLLILFTSQYLEQKHLVLVDDKRAESVRFIQLLEKQFQNEVERFPGKVTTIIDSFKSELAQHPLNFEIAERMHGRLVDSHLLFHFIASNSRQLLTNAGLYLDGQLTPLGLVAHKPEFARIDELIMKMGSCYIAFCNGTPVSQKTLTETELVADTLLRKPVDEALHIFVELAGKIGFLGFGGQSRPSFVNVLSVNSPEQGDYLGIYQYEVGKNALDFLNGNRRERLANSAGLKVVFARVETVHLDEIASFSNIEELQRLCFRLTEYPPLSAEIIKLDGKDWICSGFQSSVILGHGLIALYPVAEIDNILRKEKYDLTGLFFLNLLIVIAVSFFFSHMLLGPVKWLEEGTRAINSRDFAYRLPDLGNDEMGRMARIFNEAVKDLEELSVARVVQQQLLPQCNIDTGGFDMFGRSITLADLGGDYLDYFEIDSESFAAILGDVAGHGVGAAMIMAMAKSAIINSSDYYKAPAGLVSRLHSLIYSTKTRKQRKIMTFQYLMLNKLTHTAIYSNAGGCNPFLVNGIDGNITELSLPAAALGAFKKGDFKEMEIRFRRGDVLVLYTDGIAEARNQAGEEIGYERFKTMLLKNWSADCEEFYNSMLGEYQQWLGGAEPQDDMTMLFISLREANT